MQQREDVPAPPTPPRKVQPEVSPRVEMVAAVGGVVLAVAGIVCGQLQDEAFLLTVPLAVIGGAAGIATFCSDGGSRPARWIAALAILIGFGWTIIFLAGAVRLAGDLWTSFLEFTRDVQSRR